ncbi:MAG: ATP-dependent protease ATPase subunit HslU [Treponema sp.]|nr:ATP-dependent protease ATPase subunit HslU [Treponema sp.]
MDTLTPKEIVSELDKYIIGQKKAKRAVAIALRNRIRRLTLDPELREDIAPKNILMIGPTGVGKTEIARRLARMAGSPFIKVEATKYTEVGYVGRDVESMIRDLMSAGVQMVKQEMEAAVRGEAEKRAEEVLLDLLIPKKKKKPQGKGPGPVIMPMGGFSFNPAGGAPGPSIVGTTIKVGIPIMRDDEGGADGDDAGDDEETATIALFEEVGADGAADADTGKDAAAAADAPAGDGAKKKKAAKQAKEPEEEPPDPAAAALREKMRAMLRSGKLEERNVEFMVNESPELPDMAMFGGSGMEEMMNAVMGMVGSMGGGSRRKVVTVKRAREIIINEEAEKLVDREKMIDEAKRRVEETGIVFIDEIDKIAVKEERGGGPDVSREGVQRDILPIVEGATVGTKWGPITTDHILFIAAGAFNISKPSDLIPELQGRFPLRVELDSLGKDEFLRILREPKNALIRQYQGLLSTEKVELDFKPEAIERLAALAAEVNSRLENIGARRLHTIMEALLEDVSFDASDIGPTTVPITVAYVDEKLADIVKDQDLGRYIL